MRRRGTLRERVKARIAERRDNAFLTREFLDLGGERQVLRALRQLTCIRFVFINPRCRAAHSGLYSPLESQWSIGSVMRTQQR